MPSNINIKTNIKGFADGYPIAPKCALPAWIVKYPLSLKIWGSGVAKTELGIESETDNPL